MDSPLIWPASYTTATDKQMYHQEMLLILPC